MINWYKRWKNKRHAQAFVGACVAVLKSMYPDDGFSIRIKEVTNKHAKLEIYTESKAILACWVLIQESIKSGTDLDLLPDKAVDSAARNIG